MAIDPNSSAATTTTTTATPSSTIPISHLPPRPSIPLQSSQFYPSPQFYPPQNHLPHTIPQNAPQNVPHNVPQNGPQNVPHNVPQNVPHNFPHSVPQNVPNNVPHNVPQNVPHSVPQNVPHNVPHSVPQNVPHNVPYNVPQNVPHNVSQNVPHNVPHNVPQNVPHNVPHNVSQNVPHNGPQNVVYPVASSGRGFMPRGTHRPLIPSNDHMPISNGGGVYHPSTQSMVFPGPPHSVRPRGVRGAPLNYRMAYPLPVFQTMNPHSLHYPHLRLPAAVVPSGGSVNGLPVYAHPKGPERVPVYPHLVLPRGVASNGYVPSNGVPDFAHPKVASRSTNGYKDSRQRSRDDALTIVRDRKVRITDDSSLYALCRSWLKNGVDEEIQPQQEEPVSLLPKPSPASEVDAVMENNKEDEDKDKEEEEDEKIDEQVSAQDLLKRHIQRAKKVRARLGVERSQKIARYRNRLRLLLPLPVD